MNNLLSLWVIPFCTFFHKEKSSTNHLAGNYQLSKAKYGIICLSLQINTTFSLFVLFLFPVANNQNSNFICNNSESRCSTDILVSVTGYRSIQMYNQREKWRIFSNIIPFHYFLIMDSIWSNVESACLSTLKIFGL